MHHLYPDYLSQYLIVITEDPLKTLVYTDAPIDGSNATRAWAVARAIADAKHGRPPLTPREWSDLLWKAH